MQQQDLESRLAQMLSEITELRQQVLKQQTTIEAQQCRLNELANQASTTVTSELKPTSAVSTSRRKVLRRLAGGMVAGLALGGVSLASGGVKEAEARIISNPTNNVGAEASPSGTTLSRSITSIGGLIGYDASMNNFPLYLYPAFGTAGITKTAASVGVIGISTNVDNISVAIQSNLRRGVVGVGMDTGAIGVAGRGWGTNSIGVYGFADGLAGVFDGTVRVNGSFSATSKSFRIDHPLDPANQYLYHACLESSEQKNLYDGTVVLDSNGEAEVELPAWFEALNTSIRYQLTCIGEAAQVYIAQVVTSGKFKIAGGKAGQTVCWLITGVRKDAYATHYPMAVEVAKEGKERGKYIHPEVFGAGEDKRIGGENTIVVKSNSPHKPDGANTGK